MFRYFLGLLFVASSGLIMGCGPGAGDPEAPVESPPSVDANESAAMDDASVKPEVVK